MGINLQNTCSSLNFYGFTGKPVQNSYPVNLSLKSLSQDTVSFSGINHKKSELYELTSKLKNPAFVAKLDQVEITEPAVIKAREQLKDPRFASVLQNPKVIATFLQVGLNRVTTELKLNDNPVKASKLNDDQQELDSLLAVLKVADNTQQTAGNAPAFNGWLWSNKTILGKSANKVNQNSVLSTAIATLTSQVPPFIPLDQVNVTLSVTNMAKKIAKLYDVPWDKHLAGHVAIISGFAMGCSMGDSLIQWIPIVGNASNAVATFAINQVAGWALIALFEAAKKDPEAFKNLTSDNLKSYIKAGKELLIKWKKGELDKESESILPDLSQKPLIPAIKVT